MKSTILKAVALAAMMYLGYECAMAQDWPQWRGPNRDAKVTGFKAPRTWPKALTQKWQVKVGDGVATPALVGDRLYVFSRQGDEEIIRCLKADSGKQVWSDKYASTAIKGPAGGFPGPRSSPAVAQGKVVTLGVHGGLACHDADSGRLVWRKTDFQNSVPRFSASSSPVILDKLVIAQLGGSSGAIVAFDLATGKEQWKWTGDETAYASPAVLTIGQLKAIVAETSDNIVAVSANDGKLLWKTAYKTRYNASSPMTEGSEVIFSGSGQGTKAVKIEKKDGELKATELWSNPDHSVIYNTPVIKSGLLYGISDKNKLFCLSMKDGKTAWDAALAGGASKGGTAKGGTGKGKGKGGRGKGGRGGMMGGGGGYGSIVDAGSVLIALTPAGQLLVVEPSDKAYKAIAKYPVGEKTYAYPVVSDNRIFIKDADAVTLWTIPE